MRFSGVASKVSGTDSPPYCTGERGSVRSLGCHGMLRDLPMGTETDCKMDPAVFASLDGRLLSKTPSAYPSKRLQPAIFHLSPSNRDRFGNWDREDFSVADLTLRAGFCGGSDDGDRLVEILVVDDELQDDLPEQVDAILVASEGCRLPALPSVPQRVADHRFGIARVL